MTRKPDIKWIGFRSSYMTTSNPLNPLDDGKVYSARNVQSPKDSPAYIEKWAYDRAIAGLRFYALGNHADGSDRGEAAESILKELGEVSDESRP